MMVLFACFIHLGPLAFQKVREASSIALDDEKRANEEQV
jgi:hypothetical protein